MAQRFQSLTCKSRWRPLISRQHVQLCSSVLKYFARCSAWEPSERKVAACAALPLRKWRGRRRLWSAALRAQAGANLVNLPIKPSFTMKPLPIKYHALSWERHDRHPVIRGHYDASPVCVVWAVQR